MAQSSRSSPHPAPDRRPPLTDLFHSVAAKHALLQRLRPTARLAALEHVHDLELTWSSNAIEGNTLTAVETTLVIENGLTVGGKPLRDHLEAIDLFEALIYVRQLARTPAPLAERDIRDLHRLVLLRSQPETSGRYADGGRFVLTASGRRAFPSPAELPALMQDLSTWLQSAPGSPATAFAAHRRLVDIHPFNDGNGRTARLLMNLVLIRAGYPPIAIRPEDHLAYLDALQQPGPAFDHLLTTRLDATLDEYITAAQEPGPA